MRVRWMIRRDLGDVVRIERESFQYPWTAQEFHYQLRRRDRDVIGMVAERNGMAAGYMLYELHKRHLFLVNLAVDPQFRRSGVGSRMIAKLQRKLSVNRRESLEVKVRESNLPGLAFLRSCGFVAACVLHDEYSEVGEDAYVLRYTLADAGGRIIERILQGNARVFHAGGVSAKS